MKLLLPFMLSTSFFLSAGSLTFESGTTRIPLLECFTSQGCHSCPPGERWLQRSVDERGLWSGVVPVVYHVDYWDYLGWSDPYGSAAFTGLQRTYHRQKVLSRVYTPAFVVNGTENRSYFKGKPLSTRPGKAGNLRATLSDKHLSVEYSDAKPSLVLHIALLKNERETRVTAGENKGKTLKQNFIAIRLSHHASNRGSWKLPRDPKLEQADAIAIWVTKPDDPAPLQATGITL